MARFAELSESKLSTILEEKGAENIKKATKVTLNILRGYLQGKGLKEADLLTSKVKLADANEWMYVKLNHTFFKLLLYTCYP